MYIVHRSSFEGITVAALAGGRAAKLHLCIRTLQQDTKAVNKDSS